MVFITSRRSVGSKPVLATAGGIRHRIKAHWASVRSVLYRFRGCAIVVFSSLVIYDHRINTLNRL